MKFRVLSLCSISLLASAISINLNAQPKPLPKPVQTAMDQASADDIKATITYLADDRLLGRMPGTEGYKMASDYVIGQLKNFGVAPAGEKGGWLQTVHLRKATTQRNTEVTLTSGATDFKSEDFVKNDISITANPQLPDVSVSGQLIFAGYGVSEPKLNYDDYAGIDVKGKIVVIMRGAPTQFASSVVAHVMNTTTILRTASEHGAIGVLVAPTDSTLKFVAGTRPGQYSVLNDAGKVVVSRNFYSEQVKLFGNISYKLFTALVKPLGKTLQTILPELKAGHPLSAPLNASISASYRSDYKDIVSYNIVGKISGSDPKLKNEYVVHSAHLDHIGVGAPVQGDSIYNGAHDNASGVASLLQIAKIYHNMKVKPKRSILVVMLTGEEMGDLGSGYFALHPTVPGKQIVADVNTDMPTIIAPLLSVTALGAEHSSLSKQVDQASAYLGLSVEPDPEPDQNRFVRSDQYSFVVQGIPALHIKYGSKTADGKNNLNEFVQKWRAKYYHKPQDDINGIFDFDAGRKYAQLNFLIGYLVAQDAKRPTWNKGDIFEKH